MSKIDFSKPYGTVVGTYEVYPTAKFTQDGHFYDAQGNQLDVLAEAPQMPQMELPPIDNAPATEGGAKNK